MFVLHFRSRLFLAATSILLAACLSSLRAQGSPCQNDAVTRTAAAVQETRQKLRAISMGDDGGIAPDVFDHVSSTVLEMKGRLNEFIVAEMSCVPTTLPPDIVEIQGELSRLGHAFTLPPNEVYSDSRPADYGKYGYQLSFDVRSTADERGLVSITATFDVECGSDAMLLIFSPSSSGWLEVLRWQSQTHKNWMDAFSMFDYAISPPTPDGHWYVFTRSVNPHCASNWQSLRYDAMRPAPGNPAPSVFFSGSHGIFLGEDNPAQLFAKTNDFEIRFYDRSIDFDNIFDRVFIYHFKITADGITRVQSVALHSWDFVDEWIVSTWADASNWTTRAARQKLRSVHDELHALLNSEAGNFAFKTALHCSDSYDHYQVNLSDPQEKTWYFQVRADGIDTMTSAGQSPDPRCQGPDALLDMK